VGSDGLSAENTISPSQGASIDRSQLFCLNAGVKCEDCGKTFEPDGSATGWKNGYPKNWTEKQKEEDYLERRGPFCSACSQKYQNQHPWNLTPVIEDALKNTLADIGEPENFDSVQAPGTAWDLVRHDEYIRQHRENVIEHHLVIKHRVGRALVVYNVSPLKAGRPLKSKLYKVRTITDIDNEAEENEEPMVWVKFQNRIREIYGGNRGRAYESEARQIGILTTKQVDEWIEKQKSTSTRRDKGLTPNALLEFAKEVKGQKIGRKRRQANAKRANALVAKANQALKDNPDTPHADFSVYVPVLHHGDFEDMPLTKKLDSIISDPPYRKEDAREKVNGKWVNWYLYVRLAKWADKHLKPNRPMVLMIGSLSFRQIISVIEANGFKVWWTCIVHYKSRGEIEIPWVNTFWKPVVVFIREKEEFRDNDGNYLLIKKDAWDAGAKVDDIRTHPDQQDVETFQNIVDVFSSPAHLLCDPCMGSGTTGVGCLTMPESEDESGKPIDGRRVFCGADSDQAGKGTYQNAKHRLERAFAGDLDERGG
jgi:hypothetical protein